MTEQEKKIEEEINAIMEKKCNGRVFCKGCPFAGDELEYNCGCYGKAAIDLIIKARKEEVKICQ